jgi:hypothetical protein
MTRLDLGAGMARSRGTRDKSAGRPRGKRAVLPRAAKRVRRGAPKVASRKGGNGALARELAEAR